MFLQWLLVVLICFDGKAMGTTCESSGLGKPARVTCDFGQNVAETANVSAVFLQHLPLRDPGGNQETVVECRRFLYKEFDCLFEVDYKIIGTVSNQLTIDIPKARAEHQGIYYCLTVTEQIAIQWEPCVLEYAESKHSTTSTPPSQQENDDHLKEDDSTRNADLWIYATIIVSVLLVTAVLLFTLAIVRRIRRRKRGNEAIDYHKGAFVSRRTPAKPLHISEELSTVQKTPSCTEDNSLSGLYSTYWFTDPSWTSSGLRSQKSAREKPCTDTHPQSLAEPLSPMCPLRLKSAQGSLFTEDRRGKSDIDNLEEKGLSEDAVPSSQQTLQQKLSFLLGTASSVGSRKRIISDLGPSTALSSAVTDFSLTGKPMIQRIPNETTIGPISVAVDPNIPVNCCEPRGPNAL